MTEDKIVGGDRGGVMNYLPAREPWIVYADRCEREASALPIYCGTDPESVTQARIVRTRRQALAHARAFLASPSSPWSNPAFVQRPVALPT